MARKLLYVLAAYLTATGLFLIFVPTAFYHQTPGVAATGPYNVHFIRDVGLAFVASAGAIGWGAAKGVRSTILAGAAWPAMHALFHVQICLARGIPVDMVAGTELVAVILPPGLVLWATVRLEGAVK